MKEIKDLLTRAHELWNSGDPKIDRHNQRAWVRSVVALGDKWLLATPVPRLEK